MNTEYSICKPRTCVAPGPLEGTAGMIGAVNPTL